MHRRSPMLFWMRTAILCAVAFWHAGGAPQPAGAETRPPVAESRLKLIFLYNFARFTEWPEDTFATEEAPLEIGVLDLHALSDDLSAVADKTAAGHPIRVRACRTFEEMERCHVLYLNSSDDLYVKRVLAHLRGRPVLTVGESASFTHWGGAIRFFKEEQHVRFAVNSAAAKRSGLKLSSQLLGVARVEDREVK